MRARPAGDAALLVEADGPASGLAASVGAQRWPGIVDVVPAARTVLVKIQPGSWDLDELASRIAALPPGRPAAAEQPVIELPVCYDGPDLAEVARLAGLTVAEAAARHAGAEYTVGWLGFAPGFGYLTGLDRALCGVSRLARPRLRVRRLVAIAGRAGRRLPDGLTRRLAADRADLGPAVGSAAGTARAAGRPGCGCGSALSRNCPTSPAPHGPALIRETPGLTARRIRPGGSRPGGSQPGGSRPGGSRPGGSRPGGSRPGGSQPGGCRPAYRACPVA